MPFDAYRRLRHHSLLIVVALATSLAPACNRDAALAEPALALSQMGLIPIPNDIQPGTGGLLLSELTWLNADEGVDLSAAVLARFAETLPTALSVDPANSEGAALRLLTDPELGAEAYRLEVLPTGVNLTARTEAGYFYGLQTMNQLWRQALADGGVLAAGTITDAPRYGYRGAMLDIARHFHEPAEIRRLIDIMSGYKMNVLHLHLTDDQGWRIEIKGYPRLTAYGGSTQVGGEGGGFLTQEEYKALVAYAAERHVMIIPEVDSPGHTQAALASYPELACEGANVDLYEGTEVGFSTLCIGKPEVTKFMQTVITELAAITPGPYLHIGGDESQSTSEEDFAAFIAEMEPMVRAAGKRMIGWDEVATVDVDKSMVVQMWHSEENAAAAVAKGHKLIVSPAKFAYLDMQYDSTSRIGLHWASYIEVDRGYTWDPNTVIGEIPEASILGVEAPLWSETVVTRADIDYLVFPRLLGYAEVGWSQQADRSWETYRQRLSAHAPQMDAAGIEYYRSDLVDWDNPTPAATVLKP